MYTQKISIIIPAYNEADKIYNNLLVIEEIVERFFENFELIVVNDGSKDNTESEIKKAARRSERIVLCGYLDNVGKGGAIKRGIAVSRGDYIAFLDADLDLSPKHLEQFMEKILETHADAVIGSKMHKDSIINYPIVRRFISYTYYIILKILFKMDIKDTQTGIKLFNAEIIKKVIEYVNTDGFAYDIEILALINSFGGKIEEMPIELVFQRGNKMGRIGIKDIYTCAIDTISIWKNIHRIKKECEKYNEG